MDIAESAIGAAAPDAATTSAAAVLAALPQPAGAAAGECEGEASRTHHLPPCAHSLSNAYLYCALWCTADFSATPCASPRRDSDGQQICELCPIRLTKAKGKLHKHGQGHVCQSCYDRRRRPAASLSADAPAATKQSRKRRAQSDPGELAPRTLRLALTHRVTLPQPRPVKKQQRTTRQEQRIMQQLEETVARREAWLAAHPQATPSDQ